MKKDQFLISLLVNNQYGVLARVAGLFSKRGFNIDTLSVGETEDPHVSRITIVSTGDEYVKDQITKQLEKLVDLRVLRLMDRDTTVVREMMLVKMPSSVRAEVMEAVNVFRAKVVDMSPSTITAEITGEPQKLDAFLEFMRPLGIVELSRTGATALGRDTNILKESQTN